RVPELAVGVRAHRAGDGAVVPERALLAAPAVHVQVERVVAGVHLAAGEPAVEGLARIVEDTVPGPVPVNVRGGRGPEAFGVAHRTRVCLVIDALRHVGPPGRRRQDGSGTLSRPRRAQRGPSGRRLPPCSRFLLTISIDNGYFPVERRVERSAERRNDPGDAKPIGFQVPAMSSAGWESAMSRMT